MIQKVSIWSLKIMVFLWESTSFPAKAWFSGCVEHLQLPLTLEGFVHPKHLWKISPVPFHCTSPACQTQQESSRGKGIYLETGAHVDSGGRKKGMSVSKMCLPTWYFISCCINCSFYMTNLLAMAYLEKLQ